MQQLLRGDCTTVLFRRTCALPSRLLPDRWSGPKKQACVPIPPHHLWSWAPSKTLRSYWGYCRPTKQWCIPTRDDGSCSPTHSAPSPGSVEHSTHTTVELIRWLYAAQKTDSTFVPSSPKDGESLKVCGLKSNSPASHLNTNNRRGCINRMQHTKVHARRYKLQLAG